MYPIGAALDATAERLRSEMIELGTHLASGRCPLSWSASDMAEGNPVTFDLCLDLCRSVALIEAARAGGSHLVVVDDDALGRALVDTCRRAGIAARWRGPERSVLRALRDGLRVHAQYVRAWWARRRLMRGWTLDRPEHASDICLLTWFDRRNFAQGAMEVDRFFGKLPVWLRASGVRFAWLANPLGAMDALIDAASRARVSERVDLVAALLDLRSLLRAYLALLMLPLALRRQAFVGGIDVTALVRRALGKEMMSTRLVFAAQYLGLARQMKRRGAAPRVVFYTYENQPWEKLMLIGFRRDLPSTILIGVQHAPLAERHVGVHPGRRQWHDGTTPDVLLTIGEDFRDRLIARGAPPERLVVGGALRYPEILSAPAGTRADDGGRPRRVLAACSIDLQEATELTYKAAVAAAGLDDLELIVNCHPMVGESFRAALRERVTTATDCAHVRFVEGTADAWLGQVDIVLYNASGTSFEAVAAGVPTIFVGSEIALDMDKMAGQGTLKCRAIPELRRQIGELLRDPGVRDSCVAAGRKFLARCFAAPAPQFWAALATHPAEGRST
jgi:surface carbohydrate biosynthesis protein (TIGR04326 family)